MLSEARFPLKIDWERVMALPEWQRGGSLAVMDAPLVCFPLRSEWETLHPKGPEAFPEPLRTSRDSGGIPEYPSAVLKLQRDAQGAGWSAEALFAIGYLAHATHGRPGEAEKESWSVRLSRGGERAVAVYMGGAWRSMWRWAPWMFFRSFGGITEFTDEVAGMLVSLPSAAEWSKMHVKYPLKPTRAQWKVMRELLGEADRGLGS